MCAPNSQRTPDDINQMCSVGVDISWLNVLGKATTPCISKSLWHQRDVCLRHKNLPPCYSSCHGRRPRWVASMTFSQSLYRTSVKPRGDYNQTQSLLWAMAESTTTVYECNTHTQVRWGHVLCVFSQQCIWECQLLAVIPGFLQSQVCVTRLGSIQRDPLHSFVLASPLTNIRHATDNIWVKYFKTPFFLGPRITWWP